MKKKIIAFVMTACMAVSLAACSGARFDEKSFEKYISDELDAEEFSYDEIQEDMDDGMEKLESGVYFKTDDEETEDFIEQIGMGEMVAVPSKIDSGIIYFTCKFDGDDPDDIFIASLIKVKDADKVKKMIEESVELWDDNKDDCLDWAIADSSEDMALGVFEVNDDLKLNIGIYQSGDSVLVIYGMGSKGSKKNIQAFAEKFKLSDPIEVCEKSSKD